MCGIAGAWDPDGGSAAARGVEEICAALAHRGPDDAGVWTHARLPCALGHRRLSILELSPLGHQPMLSSSGRFAITFNGEIYNFVEIRDLLLARGHTFRGGSDTEVILAACEAWGVQEALTRFVGMFAFAIWDERDTTLTLARDRLGEKPLYYGHAQGRFLFASELGALTRYPGFSGELDREALTEMLRLGYVPGPGSIFTGMYKLPPGSSISLSVDNLGGTDAIPLPRPYWSLGNVVAQAKRDPFTGSREEAIERVHDLLSRAVDLQMVADVPVGAFLSGGVDSSTVCALMAARSPRPVHTFSIGFHEDAYDEAPHARAVASLLGTNHTEHYVSAEEAVAVVPRLPSLYSEPFGDSSQIPTHLLAVMTRKTVKVALSGDGGDELFGGYPRYWWVPRLWNALRLTPRTVRAPALALLARASPESWERVYRLLAPFLPKHLRVTRLGEMIARGASLGGARDLIDAYHRALSHHPATTPLVLGTSNDRDTVSRLRESGPDVRALELDGVEKMLFIDALTYLPDDILIKVDRAAMGASLETRIPLLDHRLIEFVWSLPRHLRADPQKSLLRGVAARYLPTSLFDRPKMGFGVPIGTWLRGPLREWGEDLLAESTVRREGVLDPHPVQAAWKALQRRERASTNLVWHLLMFQAWRRAWR